MTKRHKEGEGGLVARVPRSFQHRCLVVVDDIEVLRRHLSVDQWHVVLGGSWGSTLALAYAQAHPASLKSLVLRGVFLFTPGEIDYLFQNGTSGDHHPEAWEGYVDHIRLDPNGDWETEKENLLGAYYKRLCCDDQPRAEAAAKAFVRYELSISKTFPDPTKVTCHPSPATAPRPHAVVSPPPPPPPVRPPSCSPPS